LAGGVEEGFADAAEVARLDANENRSGVDDRVPMLNHAAVEIGQQPGPNHSFRQTPIGAKEPSAFSF